MGTLASLRSDWWTTCPELVDDFIGIRSIPVILANVMCGLKQRYAEYSQSGS